LFELAPSSGVSSHRQGAAAQGFDLTSHDLARGQVPARDHDICPRPGKGEDHFPPETATAAGDERDASA
jgi:hypothetical protein